MDPESEDMDNFKSFKNSDLVERDVKSPNTFSQDDDREPKLFVDVNIGRD